MGSINPLVDIYNTVSLTYALPCGGEDIDTFAGDLRLTVTQGGDAFRALGDEADSETLPGEVCFLESVDPARHDDLAAALDDLAARTQAALGGEMESNIVTKDSPAIALS